MSASRHVSLPYRLIATLCAGLAAGAVQADRIEGNCRYDGATIAFSDGIVFKEANRFEAGREDIVVVLTTFALDKAALAGTQQKTAALASQRFANSDGRSVRLRIAEGKAAGVDYHGDGTSVSLSGGDVGKLVLQTSDAQRVVARFTLEDDDKDDLQCALNFDLAYAAAAAPAAKAGATASGAAGKALPPGGGEPGRVFQANVAAMQKGDVDGMLATVSKAQADKMRAQRSDPKFAAMLEMMKSFAPKSATVTGGQDFGDRAELTIEAVDQSGAKSSGTSRLIKEGGQWKVEKTSMKSSS